MTYCLGMLLRDGLVMMADTRTNAGIDDLSVYRKLRILGEEGKSVIAVASAGSLSTTQIAIERAIEGLVAPDTGMIERLGQAPRIHRVAFLLGQAIRKTTKDWQEVSAAGVQFDASLLVGGCVGAERPRLFMIYGAGNFIECGPETPFLQIGERKFGKPILDRGLTYETDLYEAVKLGLLSYISTIRSNHAVDLPIDIAVVRNGATRPELSCRIEQDDSYYRQLDAIWAESLSAAIAAMPAPPYREAASGASGLARKSRPETVGEKSQAAVASAETVAPAG
jgi:putative proteasome-type protease